MTRLKGIDVSRWQGFITWSLVRQHVDFAIIKICGSDDGFYFDGQSVRNVLEARSAGLPIGFYAYIGGVSSVESEVNHIKNAISSIGGLREGEFIALDWEEERPDPVAYICGIAKGLIDFGFPNPIIYTNLNRVKVHDWTPVVSLGCGLWVAAWGNNDAIPADNEVPGSDEWPFWAFWQYSSTGSVPGIAGRVDLDVFEGDLAAFKKYGSSRNVAVPAVVNSSRVVLPANLTTYIVKPNDNLSVIAARFGKSWQALWDINRDRVSNPNRIFPGQELRIWQVEQPAVVAAPAATSQRTYTVKSGDTLSAIAAAHGITNWVLLWQANQAIVPNPDRINPGQVLVIP